MTNETNLISENNSRLSGETNKQKKKRNLKRNFCAENEKVVYDDDKVTFRC